MAHYILYHQGSFLFEERYEDALQASVRASVLSGFTHSISLMDFDSAPIPFLDMIERAISRDELIPASCTPKS